MSDPKRLPYDTISYPKLIGTGETDLDIDLYIAEAREGRGREYLQGGINAALDKAHDAAGFPKEHSHPTDRIKITLSIKAELFD